MYIISETNKKPGHKIYFKELLPTRSRALHVFVHTSAIDKVMNPVLDWFAKNQPVAETSIPGNVARSWQWRERGINPQNSASNKTVLEDVAEDILVKKPLKIRCFDLPGHPRSTFLMVFSPDGTKVASTHGNHNVYVSELASGKHVRILQGHPRTPWCVAFHPSHPQLIGSGCLGGQVRVWDISSGGSEVWNVSKETVIASIAFHPREQLLVIATFNELYFWDWSQPAPFTKVSTNNINEKVRYVAFDSLGYKLITGISLRNLPGGIGNSVLQPNSPTNPPTSIFRRDDADDNTGNNRPPDDSGSTQEIIVNSYQNLVQRYDSLVRNYQRLFMVRQRLTVTPPPPVTTDRGTDPMETDPSPEANSFTRAARTYTGTPQTDDDNSTTGTSSNRQETDNGVGEGGSSRLLNLDALSFDSGLPSDRNAARQEQSIFGSRPSAFHPLNDTSGRSFRTVDQNERASRLLPNPFSSTNGTPRPSRVSFTSQVAQPSTDNVANSLRTSLIPAYFSSHAWGDSRRVFLSVRNTNSPAASDNPSPARAARRNAPTSASNATQTNTFSSQSQSDGLAAEADARTINESLDLIRDILRDSGARLLNLIRNMSLRISPEDNIISALRGIGTDDDYESGERESTPQIRLIRSTLLQYSSESDSDPSPEVNIFRTRNSTFREHDVRDSERPERSNDAEASNSIERETHPTDRLDFELGELQLQNPTHEAGGISVSAHSSRFRVRTQNNDAGEGPSTSSNVANQEVPENSNQYDVNSDEPSSNTENILGTGQISPEEAMRRVRSGVIAVQKHTLLLANMWLRGERTTMPELRNLWENLRRRIIALHRETNGQIAFGHYRASLLERCMMLNQVANNNTRPSTRNSRPQSRNSGQNSRNSEATNTENAPSDEHEQGASREEPSTSRQSPASRSSAARSTSIQWSSPLRRRAQSSYRWRPDEELRRKSRNPATARPQRSANRPRRDIGRTMEISATRHEIRMRAMQVLSVMFNMMMVCLEERGLSTLIITMLRSLKRALALTCLMLIDRNNGRARSNNTSPQRVESLNVIRLENVDHLDPVNVDGPDEPSQNNTPSAVDEDRLQSSASKRVKRDNSTSSHSVSTENNARETLAPVPSTSRYTNVTQKWSNRLAVQISAANRNYSATARNRRELYMESRRLKALHRTNPAAHPLIKRRVLPPVSSHRIPALRSLPSRVKIRPSRAATTATTERQSEDPVPGPSGLSSDNSSRPARVPTEMNEFEQRINLIRLAHVQAVRLRNAARSRFRRLQTIRIVTPSAVREMFNLPPTTDGPPENRSPLQDWDSSNRRSFSSFDYRPHFLTRERILSRGATNRPTEESRMEQYQAAIEDAAAATIPLLQVGDLSINNPDVQANPPPRLQRNQQIHEYLQPIILAQNAMVIDDEGNGPAGGGGGGLGGARRMGGMAGLLDASFISETLSAPSHRVQAWDFTTGNAPDIADSTKNVVVSRCRIHNDASIDISKDGRLLVALHTVPRLRNTNHLFGVYSLEWSRLGQCLFTAALEQSAVSVALSPTARHLAVGLGSRRFTLAPHGRSSVFALLYRLDPLERTSTGLPPIKELEQTWENGFTSLNCLRWAPQPGQGLVYANNTGQLIIMS